MKQPSTRGDGSFHTTCEVVSQRRVAVGCYVGRIVAGCGTNGRCGTSFPPSLLSSFTYMR
jgi:hypothetical protein